MFSILKFELSLCYDCHLLGNVYQRKKSSHEHKHMSSVTLNFQKTLLLAYNNYSIIIFNTYLYGLSSKLPWCVLVTCTTACTWCRF